MQNVNKKIKKIAEICCSVYGIHLQAAKKVNLKTIQNYRKNRRSKCIYEKITMQENKRQLQNLNASKINIEIRYV